MLLSILHLRQGIPEAFFVVAVFVNHVPFKVAQNQSLQVSLPSTVALTLIKAASLMTELKEAFKFKLTLTVLAFINKTSCEQGLGACPG
jgi:hypothetical protein